MQLYHDNDKVGCQMQSILVQLFSFQLKLLLSRPPAHLFIIITMFLSMYKFNAVWRSVERATFIRFCFNRTPRLFASFCHFHDIGNINNDQSSHLHSSFFTPSHIEILFNYVKIMGNVRQCLGFTILLNILIAQIYVNKENLMFNCLEMQFV